MATNKIKTAFSLLLLITLIGTEGYHLIEGWSFVDSFYATIVTLATVGYGDFYPVTTAGRIFAVFLIVVGVGTMAYTFAIIMENFMEGRLKKLLGRGKLERQLKRMKNHHIICGCGKIGHIICEELAEEGADFVVVDSNLQVIQKMEEKCFTYVAGSATDDETLLAAGIERAKSVVCTLPSDADNLYIVLTAKELNPHVYIMSRFEDDLSERRLLKAGADRAISPSKVGGMRMTQAILRPAMLDFIEITTTRQSLELRMEELIVCKESNVVGKNLVESGIRREYGLIIVAVKKDSGKMIFNPSASYLIEPMDKLIALGEESDLVRFSEICQV